jgi:hypothetical protein
MFCGNCGASIEQGQAFCSRCGRPVGTARAEQPVFYPGRVARHVKTVAILWVIWSGLKLLAGLGMVFFGTLALARFFVFVPFQAHWHPFWMGSLMGFGGAVEVLFGIAGIIAAWGLFERRPWARVLTIILAFITLFRFPLGTALGIYTLWVLLPAHCGEEYRRMCPTT